jgi:glycosyltransferase involved in cell wall biosynthesis
MHKLPTPYNDRFFSRLADEPNVKLQVHHLWQGTWQRPWQSQLGHGYPNRYMRLRLGVDWPFLRAAWREKRAMFLLVDWGHAASLLAITIRILRRAPVSLWVDTPQEHRPRKFWRRAPRRWILAWILRHVDVVFGTGEPARKQLLRMGMPPEKFVNLPWFVDVEAIRLRSQSIEADVADFRHRLGIGDNDVLYTMVGTIFDRKGHDLGLRAFIRLFSTSQNVYLALAGEGPDRQALESQAAAAGLGKKFRVLGWLEPDEMDVLYAATDVLVHPARFDPYPLAVLEAMAWGTTVVGSDASGSAVDRIASGESGFITRSGDVDELYAAMLTTTNPEVRGKCGAAAAAISDAWPLSRGVHTLVSASERVIRDHAS